MKQCTTYIDEAGQTGYNIWDYQEQPFFVLAGVTVEEGSSAIADYVEHMFQTHKQPNQTEFKTHEWLKRSGRRQCVLDMLRYICEHAVDVNAVIVEKRFMIASLIVHKFFDGAYNDFEDYTWVNDKAERLKAANYYYELFTDDDLSKMGNYIMHPDEMTINLWDILWEKTDEPEYKKVLVGVEEHLDNIISEFHSIASGNESLNETNTNSPNFTAFSQLGNMIAASCMFNRYTTRLVFDDCPSYRNEYEYLFNFFQNISVPNRLYPILGVCSWKNKVTDFTIGNSRQDYNLQATDVVASSVYHVLKNLSTNKAPRDFDKNMLDQIGKIVKGGNLWLVTSETFKNKLGKII